MTWNLTYTPAVWPMLTSAILSAAIAIYAWRHRTVPGALAFSIQEWFIALWALFTAIEMAATTTAGKVLCHKLETAAAIIAMSAMIFFALELSFPGKWSTRRHALLLALATLLFLALMATDPLHHLIWTRLWFDQTVRIERGPLNFLVLSWALMLPTLALLLFLRLTIRSTGIYSLQALLLFCATALPLLTYVLQLTGIEPFSPLDPVILMWNVSSLLFAVAIFRFGLLGVVPIGYDTAIDRMMNGVMILDAENRIVDLNPAAMHELALARGATVGQPAGKALAAYPDLARLLSQKDIPSTEIMLDRAGQPRHFHVHASPLAHPSGFHLGQLAILQDVTERKQAEAALKASEEIQRLIIENASDGIAIYEEFPDIGERKLLDCNERYAQMSGRSREELLAIGDPARVQTPIPPVSYARPREEIRAAQSEGFFSWVRPDGKENIIEYNAASIRVGERLLTIGLDRDVTERKQAEAQILEQQRALAMLKEREQLARELHDSIGQLLGYAYFQVEAAIKLIRDGQIDPALAQLNRLASAVHDAHADVRENILNLRTAPTPDQPLVLALQKYLEGFTNNYGIQTQLTIDPKFSQEHFAQDAQMQIFRILQEALSNARKHGQARLVQITFTAEDGRICVTVQDDGQGFTPAENPLPNSHHYGLQFMRERAVGLGGLLLIKSSPGEGTRVMFEVPIELERDLVTQGRGDLEEAGYV